MSLVNPFVFPSFPANRNKNVKLVEAHGNSGERIAEGVSWLHTEGPTLKRNKNEDFFPHMDSEQAVWKRRGFWSLLYDVSGHRSIISLLYKLKILTVHPATKKEQTVTLALIFTINDSLGSEWTESLLTKKIHHILLYQNVQDGQTFQSICSVIVFCLNHCALCKYQPQKCCLSYQTLLTRNEVTWEFQKHKDGFFGCSSP